MSLAALALSNVECQQRKKGDTEMTLHRPRHKIAVKHMAKWTWGCVGNIISSYDNNAYRAPSHGKELPALRSIDLAE